MEIAPYSTNPAMAASVRQLAVTSQMQTAVLKQIADSQQQMAELLQAIAGIGETIDTHA